jgi:restriction endonuclease Mrr
MYVVVRQYAGEGASQLFDELANRRAEVEEIIRGVSGFVSYTLARTGDGGVSVTVCQDKAGTDESMQVAASWIKENMSIKVAPPTVSEGETILHFGA